jgi:predicted LPLAT superfamily acyltransferase
MNESHWSSRREAAAGYWNVRLMLTVFRLLPVVFLRLIAFPVGFCYFLFSKSARGFSRLYLRRVSPGLEISSLSHILAFSLALVEKVEAWGGKASFKRIHFQPDDAGDLLARLERGEGAFLLSSHLGNMEFIRALAGFNRTGVSREIQVNAIVDFSVTAHFNRMLKELNPHSTLRLINARNMGPETVISLEERLAAGELVVIAADRTAATTDSRFLSLDFLGAEAPFPYGPFFLAALTKAQVYSVFALRQKDVSLFSRYDMHVHKSSFSFDCPRHEREQRIRALARWFSSLLEGYCKEHPRQWYNFFDFWHTPESSES